MITATRVGAKRQKYAYPLTPAMVAMMRSIAEKGNRHHHLTPKQATAGSTAGCEHGLIKRGFVLIDKPGQPDQLTEAGKAALAQHDSHHVSR
jgi:hypothetical protein